MKEHECKGSRGTLKYEIRTEMELSDYKNHTGRLLDLWDELLLCEHNLNFSLQKKWLIYQIMVIIIYS